MKLKIRLTSSAVSWKGLNPSSRAKLILLLNSDRVKKLLSAQRWRNWRKPIDKTYFIHQLDFADSSFEAILKRKHIFKTQSFFIVDILKIVIMARQRVNYESTRSSSEPLRHSEPRCCCAIVCHTMPYAHLGGGRCHWLCGFSPS